MNTIINITNTTVAGNMTLVLPWYTLTLTGVISGLSMVGCVIIFFSYWLCPEIRNFTRKLLMYLTFADMLTAFGFFAGNARYAAMHFTSDSDIEARTGWFCIIQSFLTTFSNMASYFWTVFIAGHLWCSLKRSRDMSECGLVHATLHVIAWGIPLVISCTALGMGVFGEDDENIGTGSWCFIKGTMSNRNVILWILFGSAVWELLCYPITCTICVLLMWYLYRARNKLARHRGDEDENFRLQYLTRNRQRLEEIAPHLRDEDRNFLFAGLVLYILKMWGTIRFLWLAIKPNAYSHPSQAVSLDVLQNLQSALSAAQGFANCIFFCILDKTVRTQMKQQIRCCREDGENEPLLRSNDEGVN